MLDQQVVYQLNHLLSLSSSYCEPILFILGVAQFDCCSEFKLIFMLCYCNQDSYRETNIIFTHLQFGNTALLQCEISYSVIQVTLLEYLQQTRAL